jgi:hypothetical protein
MAEKHGALTISQMYFGLAHAVESLLHTVHGEVLATLIVQSLHHSFPLDGRERKDILNVFEEHVGFRIRNVGLALGLARLFGKGGQAGAEDTEVKIILVTILIIIVRLFVSWLIVSSRHVRFNILRDIVWGALPAQIHVVMAFFGGTEMMEIVPTILAGVESVFPRIFAIHTFVRCLRASGHHPQVICKLAKQKQKILSRILT